MRSAAVSAASAAAAAASAASAEADFYVAASVVHGSVRRQLLHHCLLLVQIRTKRQSMRQAHGVRHDRVHAQGSYHDREQYHSTQCLYAMRSGECAEASGRHVAVKTVGRTGRRTRHTGRCPVSGVSHSGGRAAACGMVASDDRLIAQPSRNLLQKDGITENKAPSSLF